MKIIDEKEGKKYMTGEKANIKGNIRSFLSKYVSIEKLDDDKNIFQSGLVDSLFAMQLVNWLEEEYGMSISNDQLDLENFKSINAISNLINSNLHSEG